MLVSSIDASQRRLADARTRSGGSECLQPAGIHTTQRVSEQCDAAGSRESVRGKLLVSPRCFRARRGRPDPDHCSLSTNPFVSTV